MSLLAVLLLQGRTLPDTLVARLVPPTESWFAQTTDVASGILTLLTVALFVGAIWTAIHLRKSFERAQASLDEVGRDLRKLVERANAVAENASRVSTALREELDEVRETVDYANRRARHAVTVMADRVDEFNSALTSVQRDAQGIVVTALAALRGVRAGVSALRKRPRRPQPAEVAFAEDDDIVHDLPVRPRLRRRARGEP